ncbi:hypothetical protein HHK36_028443 [Tetracentron sinense]|uniref:phosphomevalonate kinase n=1 Tax=Tetracentron sinense TaxID=13715 RepID=A0A835D2L2_TETSI|nr:hypothetical protein HHK36_028443 [Tetracentron sinense]
MAVIASAPGKVLMTGGYLILERPNAGIVLSTNARFYAIVKPVHEDLKPDSWAWWLGFMNHYVKSDFGTSQITEAAAPIGCFQLGPTINGELRNPFVEQAVMYAVAAAHAISDDKGEKDLLHKLLLQGLDITIIGCNDFYSYRNQIEARGLPLTPEALASLPPFSSITFNAEGSNGENCKPEVAKTGLGSSAAMTTAVVAALLHYLGVVNLSVSIKTQQQEKTNSADLDLVHVVAQSAHCIAQGKVGSGFDVAMKGKPLQDVIVDVLKGNWDHENTQFSLPPLMTLVLGEPGTGGSSTPSMVGAVKKWQVSDPPKSLDTWRKLAEANSALETQLNVLSKLAEEQWETYKCVISSCSELKSEKWMEQATDPCKAAVVKALLGARDAVLEIRLHMRQMGEAAGVPIEPESQTKLLDATMNVEGVLLAGVPGAGGFDAIFAVTLGESSINVTKTWSSFGVLSLLVREDPRGVSLESDDPRAEKMLSAISSIHIE